MNIREALEKRCLKEELICEAVQNAKDLVEAGYDDNTVKALYESYVGEGSIIEGQFTVEKLMMTADPDQAFVDFWEDTNA